MIYYITSPKSVNRRIELTDPMTDDEIKGWEFRDSTPREIVLRGPTGVFCTLREDRGIFRGRDIRGGYTILRPETPASDARVMPSRKRPETPKQVDRRFLPVDEFQPQVDKIVDSLIKTKKAAIAVIGCNRPHYMQEVINGLKQNNLTKYDVILFLDKPKDQSQWGAIQAQIDMGLTTNVVEYPVNYGCGRALIDVRRQIFDRMGYEKAFIFEDDMVPGQNYLKFCENLLAWGQSKYTNIGAVQGWSKCLLPKDEKTPLESQVHVTYTNWWGYLTTKSAWDQVKRYIYSYRDTYLLGDYAVRPTPAILSYFKPQANSQFRLIDGGLLPDDISLRHRRNLFDSIPSGQDGATWLAYDKAGLVRLAPTVNRSLYIGKEGIHSTPEIFSKQRFDRMVLDEFPGDSRLKSFRIRGE